MKDFEFFGTLLLLGLNLSHDIRIKIDLTDIEGIYFIQQTINSPADKKLKPHIDLTG